jgi:hypothetical protein
MMVADEMGIRTALGDNFKKVFAKAKDEVIDALARRSMTFPPPRSQPRAITSPTC